MDEKLEQWRKDGKHLPEFLKDFHDQKDFFKFLHEFAQVDQKEIVKDINWMEGQIYTIDVFLRVLARFGWSIQRNKSDQNFDNLNEIINLYTEKRNEMFTSTLLSQFNKVDNSKKG